MNVAEDHKQGKILGLNAAKPLGLTVRQEPGVADDASRHRRRVACATA
jgi:hypothetical protein